MARLKMKHLLIVIVLILLIPLSVWSGVIFGNINLQDNGKERPAGDTLRVVLLPDDGSIAAEALADPETKNVALTFVDTTDAYAAFNLFVDGTGKFKLFLYGKAKGALLAAPLSVQVYEEPVEYKMLLTRGDASSSKFKYVLRRK
jgi:hypothetical protein